MLLKKSYILVMIKLFFILLLCLFPLTVLGQGLDTDTSLLLHMDGANNGVLFPDSSLTNNKGNANVTATVTTQTGTKKWGTASGQFDGDSGYLDYADHADWDISGSAVDDWTIDLQAKHTDHAAGECYIAQFENSDNHWRFFHYHGYGLRMYSQVEGAILIDTGYAGEIADNEWYHIALIKVGSEYGIYLDGTQVSHTSDSGTDTLVGNLYVGQRGGGNYYFDGYMDELRIQHSNYFEAAPNAELTNTITPPTEAYSEAVAAVGQVIFISEN